MNAVSVAQDDARSARRAKLELLLAAMVPAWGRAVVVIVCATLAANAVGLGDESGYAMIPGIFMALGPPVGRLASRVATVVLATVLIACLTAIGAELSRWTAAVTIGLVVIGFAMGLLPRLGPRSAAMQLPLLMAFVYSAAFPLSEASTGSRVAAVFVALPVYVVGVAVLFQTDARRPLLLGAAAAFKGLADALEHAAKGATDATREAELALVKFRVVSGRMKDAAVPVSESLDSRAGRLLTVSIQQAVTAAELLAGDARRWGERRRERVTALTIAARGLAAALARAALVPSPDALEDLAAAARSDGDSAVALLADALADASRAVAVLHGTSHELPSDRLVKLPGALTRLRGALTPDDPIFRRAVRLAVAAGLAGLVAELADLNRSYWAVFAVIVVLNAPAALDWRRALMRIGGTVAGFLLAIGLVELVGHDSTLAFALALVILLPGLLLMPINYAAAVMFITCTVSMLFSVSGEESDFLEFRVVDNAVGVAVVCAVGLLLWRTGRADWWRVARLAARSLANAFAVPRTAEQDNELVTRALQLRTETVEAAAIPDTTPAFAASWTYVAAAEDLIRMLVGPTVHPEPVDDRAALAARLRAIEAQCVPDGASMAAVAAGPGPTTRAALDVTRMETAVAVLHEQR